MHLHNEPIVAKSRYGSHDLFPIDYVNNITDASSRFKVMPRIQLFVYIGLVIMVLDLTDTSKFLVHVQNLFVCTRHNTVGMFTGESCCCFFQECSRITGQRRTEIVIIVSMVGIVAYIFNSEGLILYRSKTDCNVHG